MRAAVMDRVSKAVARAQQQAQATEEAAKNQGRPAQDKLIAPTPRALERMWKRILNP